MKFYTTMANYLIYIIIITLMGCASIETQQRMSLLDAATSRYGDAIRWGYFDTASGFRASETAEISDETAAESDQFKKIRVTSYEPSNRKLSEDNLEARQTVKIKYYFTNRMVERTLLDTQIWRYDPEDDRWYLHSSLPKFIRKQ